ncbi:MAG: hypothetical protein KYX68_02395 [Flavobacterium sp.]|nr:hypothetical protein [Flavobacterium sp.]
MKKILLLFVLTLVSCVTKVKKEELQLLNGYWEIEEVKTKDGSKKAYKINEALDYFFINDSLKGFRKKVVPQYDGKLLTNDVEEKLEIQEKESHFYIHYKTEFSSWEEEILELSNTSLVVKNTEGIEYHYKRKQKDE